MTSKEEGRCEHKQALEESGITPPEGYVCRACHPSSVDNQLTIKNRKVDNTHPEAEWEEEFDRFVAPLFVTGECAKVGESFIHQTLATERQSTIQKILKNKHWVFTTPFGGEFDKNGEVKVRERKDEEYIKVSDLLEKLKDR